MKWSAAFVLASLLGATILSAQGRSALFLAPKATAPAGWIAPNKPWTKLSDVLAKHAGESDWTETVVSDDLLRAEYISMAPGKRTPRRVNADTREWWIVQDGQVRFTIDGIEPFVASKGWLVQVPYRNLYQIETVGDRPSLRFEVNIANATRMYPLDETPVAVAGKTFTPVRVQGGKGAYRRSQQTVLRLQRRRVRQGGTRRRVRLGRARFCEHDRRASASGAGAG